MSAPVVVEVPRSSRSVLWAALATVIVALALASVFALAQSSTSSDTSTLQIAPASELGGASSEGCAWAGGRGPGPDGLETHCLQRPYEPGPNGPR